MQSAAFDLVGEFAHSVNFRHHSGEPVQLAIDPEFDPMIARAEPVDVGDFVPASLRTRQVRPISGFAKPSIRSDADQEGSVSSQNAQNKRRFRPLKWLGIRR